MEVVKQKNYVQIRTQVNFTWFSEDRRVKNSSFTQNILKEKIKHFRFT